MSWPDQNSSWDVRPRQSATQGQQLPENFLKIYTSRFLNNMTALFMSQESNGSLLIWKKKTWKFRNWKRHCLNFVNIGQNSIPNSRSKGLIKITMAIWDCLSCCDCFWSGLFQSAWLLWRSDYDHYASFELVRTTKIPLRVHVSTDYINEWCAKRFESLVQCFSPTIS